MLQIVFLSFELALSIIANIIIIAVPVCTLKLVSIIDSSSDIFSNLQAVERKDKLKYLEVIFDLSLSYKYHVEQTVIKCKHDLAALMQT